MSTGVLLVRVVDPSGAPVVGLTVQASSGRGDDRWWASAVTGDDGVARFAGIPFGPATLRTRPRQGWVSPYPGIWLDGTGPSRVFVSSDPTEAVLPVAPAARLRVRVTDEAGIPFAGAAVLHGPRDQGWWASETTDSYGTCVLERLEPGAGRLGVVLPPRRPDAVEERWTDTFRWIPLVPDEDASVEVAVRRHPAGAIEVAGPPDGEELELVHADAPLWYWRRATVADGLARFEGLQPGRYVVRAPKAVAGPPLATVEVGEAPVRIAVTPPDRANLDVEVVERDGRPIEGARVLFQAIPIVEQAEGTTGPDGRVRLPAVPLGEAYLGAMAPGFLGDVPTIRHDGSGRRLVLERAREIVVRGRVPAELEGALVAMGVATGGKELRASGSEPVRDGAFELRSSIKPGVGGSVVVRVAGKVPVVRPFDADAPEVDLGELAPEDGATLRGRAADRGLIGRGAHTWIEVRTASHGVFHQHLQPDGTFEVRGVPFEEIELYLSVSDIAVGDGKLSATLRLRVEAQDVDLGLVELHPHDS